LEVFGIKGLGFSFNRILTGMVVFDAGLAVGVGSEITQPTLAGDQEIVRERGLVAYRGTSSVQSSWFQAERPLAENCSDVQRARNQTLTEP
jgi:hypothetical protein